MFDYRQYANPPAAHRSLPLWSWNDKLEEEELRDQIRRMNEAGVGGFVMHARSGLRTPYMGEAWMNAVRIAIDEAESRGMEAWCYDENGWPSGTANGIVPGLDRAYRQQWLTWRRLEIGETAAGGPESADGSARLLAVLAYGDQGWKLAEGSDASLREPRLAVYVRENPHYVDILHPGVIEAFLKACHVRYEDEFASHFGRTLRGIFSDEFKFHAVPWSEVLVEAYASRWKRELLADLPFVLGGGPGWNVPADDVRGARYRFWETVSGLFERSVARIGEWCRERGWQLTGHIMGEDDLPSQMRFSAGVMPLYAHMDAPGIDYLGRDSRSPMLPKQLASVARQTGKAFTLTETFGCGGWNLTFEEMKRLGEWQFALGVDRLCPHLQGYSMQGVRKRDYPPSIFVQQPWWSEYGSFESHFARLSYLLSLGEADTGVLVLHPIRSAWLLYDAGDESDVAKLSEAFDARMQAMLDAGIDFDLGDESVLSAHGSVADDRFVVGRAAYHTVVLPGLLGISDSTFRLLQAFAEGGGRIVVHGEPPAYRSGERDAAMTAWFKRMGVIRCGERPEALTAVLRAALDDEARESDSPFSPVGGHEGLLLRRRVWPGGELRYYVNAAKERTIVLEKRPGAPAAGSGAWRIAELAEGTLSSPLGDDAQAIVLAPGDSVALLRVAESETVPGVREAAARGACPGRVRPTGRAVETIPLGEAAWTCELAEPNVLTLDYARHRIGDGNVAWSGPEYVLKIQERCIAAGKPVPLELVYAFEVDESVDDAVVGALRLAMEDRSGWTVLVNDLPLPEQPDGSYRDHAIRTYSLRGLAKRGRNAVRMSRTFVCNDEVYAYYGNADPLLAPIRNKLVFDTEIESVYVLGAFGVRPAKIGIAAGDTLTAEGPFAVVPVAATATSNDVAAAGRWFYAGALNLSLTVMLPDEVRRAGRRWALRWDRMTFPVCKASANGLPATAFPWGPYAYDLTEAVETGSGRLRLELELFASCRNVFGPHHHLKGEVTFVGPTSFTDRIGWVDAGATRIWTDRYAFLRYGLDNLRIEAYEEDGR